MPNLVMMRYDEARPRIANGSIALCRASSLEGEIIARETGSPYVHATLLGWLGPRAGSLKNVLMIGETRQRKDGRLIALGNEVAKWPGYYDVYRVSSAFYDGWTAWEFMARASGTVYGWNHILRVFLRHRFGECCRPIPNSDDPQWPRDCSALVHAALRAGCGPQLRPYDCDVVPGDLANPDFFQYLCTLY